MRMLSLVLSLTALTWAASASADDIAARRAAAERYEQTTPVAPMIQATVAQLAQQLPADRRAEFIAAMANLIDVARLREIMLDAMVRHFTAGELDALARFYGSPEGRAVVAKMPGYMADMMPPLQQEVLSAAQQLLSRPQ